MMAFADTVFYRERVREHTVYMKFHYLMSDVSEFGVIVFDSPISPKYDLNNNTNNSNPTVALHKTKSKGVKAM